MSELTDKLKTRIELFKSAVEHGRERADRVHTLKVMRELKLPLTPLQDTILIKEETLKLKKQFFDKYQLGDPQEIEDLYQELCLFIDMDIEEYKDNAKAAR